MFGKKFAFGVNYFSSQTALNMWRDFSAECVEKDLLALRKHGVKWLRVFLLWNQFQEENGISNVMAQRLEELLNLCYKYGFRADIAFFGGGEEYIPDSLKNKNIFSSPAALALQQKYVKGIVSRFLLHPAVGGWNIGNEYSLTNKIRTDIDAQENWVMIMNSCIKAIDKDHPVISGQPSLSTKTANLLNSSGWQLLTHAQWVDILTTHAYPCYRNKSEKLNTMRTIIYAAAESSMLEDVGRKEAFIEEIGCKGFDNSGLNDCADFIRGNLLSAFLHGCHAYFWQSAFTNEKYGCGLLNADRSENHLTKEVRKLMNVISQIELPKYTREAVCVIPYNVNKAHSLAANVTCLATQNDFGVEFCFLEQELPEAKLYILPSLEGEEALGENAAQKLLEKARKGAVLYISMGSANLKLSCFKELFSVAPKNYITPLTVDIGGTQISARPCCEFNFKSKNGKSLATFSDGTDAIVAFNYGSGKVIISLFSCEKQLANLNTAFQNEVCPPYYEVYSLLQKSAQIKPLVYTENKFVGAMEHKIDSKKSIFSIMNYSNTIQEYTIGSTAGYHVKKVLYGELDGKLNKNDAVIYEIEKY